MDLAALIRELAAHPFMNGETVLEFVSGSLRAIVGAAASAELLAGAHAQLGFGEAATANDAIAVAVALAVTAAAGDLGGDAVLELLGRVLARELADLVAAENDPRAAEREREREALREAAAAKCDVSASFPRAVLDGAKA